MNRRRALLPWVAAALLASAGGAAAADVEAVFFGPAAPGAAQPCSGCHGIDANGNREGARSMPPIGWKTLSAPGAGRPGYDEAALALLLKDGIGRDGKQVSALMPRYDLTAQDVSALVRLLDTIGDRQRQGVYADRLDFGIILPPAERMQPHHQRAASIVRQILDGANEEGGVFGRRLQLLTFSGRADFERRALQEPVLAALLTLDHPPGNGAKRALLPGGVPELFPVAPVDAQDDARRVRGFAASEADIARSLVDRLVSQEEGPVLILDDGTPLSRHARRAAEIAVRAHDREPLKAADKPRSDWPRAALLLGSPEIHGCPDNVRTVGGSIDTLARLGARRVAECNWSLVLADPRFEPNPAHPNAKLLQQMASQPGLLDTDRGAFVAGQLVLRAVILVGRSVNRRTLVEALDRIGPQEFGIWPALDYSRNSVNGTREVLIETAGAATAKADR